VLIEYSESMYGVVASQLQVDDRPKRNRLCYYSNSDYMLPDFVLCLALGIQLSPQLRRIRTYVHLRMGRVRFRVQTDGGCYYDANRRNGEVSPTNQMYPNGSMKWPCRWVPQGAW